MSENLVPARKWCAANTIPQRTFDDKESAVRKELTAAGAIVEIGKRLYIRPDRAQKMIDAHTVQADRVAA